MLAYITSLYGELGRMTAVSIMMNTNVICNIVTLLGKSADNEDL